MRDEGKYWITRRLFPQASPRIGHGIRVTADSPPPLQTQLINVVLLHNITRAKNSKSLKLKATAPNFPARPHARLRGAFTARRHHVLTHTLPRAPHAPASYSLSFLEDTRR
ncbi:hypothetical protein DPEC_G00055390 [Dallia pectoralis]|uniref:Uncharacterized protein n=1 Tax=Dallia pectoralis TaxID=75939 RepID=A0ACC2H662_DALPE|nr:hypothetical protein DPEC_G00055390 [Dallia pectoralis]